MAKSSANTQKQHVDIFRKSLLRKRCKALPGAVYIPFCGDGDLAVAHFDTRHIYGADIDPACVLNAQIRLPNADIRIGDCDGWLFPDVKTPFACADFDAYVNPYKSLIAFWTNAQKRKRIVLFGTDGMRQRIKRAKVVRTLPQGKEFPSPDWRKCFNFWWTQTVLPFLIDTIRSYKVVEKMFYLRGPSGMLYWGIVAEK